MFGKKIPDEDFCLRHEVFECSYQCQVDVQEAGGDGKLELRRVVWAGVWGAVSMGVAGELVLGEAWE